ncbi:uncharacterized protein LOC101453545 [Ceratitis capitata]|uniref:(Mediterranean fruit fly) hypothetical protein n=1 Tax=Ceratitis capitata TaxID=7213 RepID=A0A811U048_CERCA|nr:uncharacterized protein LOC101453545 [Ceratitis capitata]CAD6992454.1 unnamed protein product [Ceratitis capitata]
MILKVEGLFCLLLLSAMQICAYNTISGILDRATDLTPEEMNALRPLFYYLQEQYDYILTRMPQGSQEDDQENNDSVDSQLAATQAEFAQYFPDLYDTPVSLANAHSNCDKYNTTLPTVAELIGNTPTGVELNSEALAERVDIESLVEEALSEAQQQIDEIVRRSLQLESQLLKINKLKIVKYVLEALSVLFKIATRGARAAYCTYSHIPQLNVSLLNIYDGVDCYAYSKRLLLRVEQETVLTVSTIRKNVYSLAGIYKKIANKKSLLGKLTTALLNLTNIIRNIKESYVLGSSALDKVKNELPDAALGSANCSRGFVGGIPQMVETVANLSTCIMFVDNTTNDYDFMKPENERDFN